MEVPNKNSSISSSRSFKIHFFIKLLYFSVLFLIINILISGSVTFFYNSNKELTYTVDSSKHILIIGASFTEYALNDSLIPGAINFSSSGEAYFFTYLKLRTFLEFNPQIDSVILNFGGLLMDTKENYFEEMYIADKFFINYYLMTKLELYELFLANPKAVVRQIFSIPIRFLVDFLNILVHGKSYIKSNLGGYIYTEESFISEDRKRVREVINSEYQKQITFSKIQTKYIEKCYDLCLNSGVTVFLFKSPIDKIKKESARYNIEYYIDYANSSLPDAILLNYTNYKLDDSCFFDTSHLNCFGAKIISEELVKRLSLIEVNE